MPCPRFRLPTGCKMRHRIYEMECFVEKEKRQTIEASAGAQCPIPVPNQAASTPPVTPRFFDYLRCPRF